MGKYAAFGTELQAGTSQVETAVVTGDCTGNGDLTVTVTAAGMGSSPKAIGVTIADGDTADQVAAKIIAVLAVDADVIALFTVGGSGPNVTLTRTIAAANDATLNIAVELDTATGVNEDTSSNNTTAGVALTAIAKVKSLSGPALSADTEDVTSHDSTNAWEEVVVTILRSGELSLDLVYDPADDTHDATAGNGLLSRYENKTMTNFAMIFPDTGTTTWYFNGFVTGFEPDAPHDGALTASAKDQDHRTTDTGLGDRQWQNTQHLEPSYIAALPALARSSPRCNRSAGLDWLPTPKMSPRTTARTHGKKL